MPLAQKVSTSFFAELPYYIRFILLLVLINLIFSVKTDSFAKKEHCPHSSDFENFIPLP